MLGGGGGFFFGGGGGDGGGGGWLHGLSQGQFPHLFSKSGGLSSRILEFLSPLVWTEIERKARKMVNCKSFRLAMGGFGIGRLSWIYLVSFLIGFWGMK